MEKKLLLIMVSEPLTKYFYDKYFSYREPNSNWRVEFWNILPLINKRLNNSFSVKENRIKDNKDFKNIENIKDLTKELKKLPNKFFYDNQGHKVFKSILIERLINFKGGEKIYIKMSGLRVIDQPFNKKLKFALSNLNLSIFKKLVKFPKNLLLKLLKDKILRVKPKIYFVPNNYWKNIFSKNKKNKVKLIHDYDYEVFCNSIESQQKNEYITFIDQMQEFSLDHMINYSSSPYIEKDSYWQRIDNFLKFIFEKTGVDPIVAAAHRRRTDDIPIKRRFIFDQTIELIKNSKLVITHDSTAIHMALLFKKPIIFLYINEFKSKYEKSNQINYFTDFFQSKLINLEDFLKNKSDFNISNYIKVNNNKYDEYINAYLNPEKKFSGSLWKKILIELDKEIL